MPIRATSKINEIDWISPNPPPGQWLGMKWIETVSLTDSTPKWPDAGTWIWDGFDWVGDREYRKFATIDQGGNFAGGWSSQPSLFGELYIRITKFTYTWFIGGTNNATNNYAMQVIGRTSTDVYVGVSSESTTHYGNFSNIWQKLTAKIPVDFETEADLRITRNQIRPGNGTPGPFFGEVGYRYVYIRP